MNDSSGKRNNLSLCRGPSGLKRVKSGQIDKYLLNNQTIPATINQTDVPNFSLSTSKEIKPAQNDCQQVSNKPKNHLQSLRCSPKIQTENLEDEVSKKQKSLSKVVQWDEEEAWLNDLGGSQFDDMARENRPGVTPNSFRNDFPNESIRQTQLQTKDIGEKTPNEKNVSSRNTTRVEFACSTQINMSKSDFEKVNILPGLPLSPIIESANNKNEKSKSLIATTSSPGIVRIRDDNLDNSKLSVGAMHNQWRFWDASRANLNVTGQREKQTITSKMMDRFKLNFMNQNFVKPLMMTANSQSLEMALCEAAFVNDIDSQFGCTTFYGLPPYVKSLLEKYKGIKDLYEWQKECLKLGAIQLRKNLIYSLPTSGGKTLVAEILIWREVLCMEKDVILVLPYVSIVQEKMRTMNNFAVELNFNLEEYSGSKGLFPPKKHRKKHCVYIATIEKAHTLINSLLEQKRIGELGLMVVDELHMIGDSGGRGCILENLLTKLMFSSRNTMIIGMSATLGNTSELQTFLNAEVYRGNFRPVELKEYVKLGDTIFSVNPDSKTEEEFIKKFRVFDDKIYTPEKRKQDPDCITGLVMEVMPQNSCLVFCPTKKNCENVAKLICKIMPSSFKENKVQEKMDLLDAIRSEGSGEICSVLQRTIPYGVAYHHSGLTQEERRLLEEGYTAGTLACLCCTSTLAAGVNLPAKRVILRSSYIGIQFLSHSQMKQMIGRAGRAGIDTTGESIIIIQPGEEQKIANLLREKMERSVSNLMQDKAKGLKLLLLSAIGLQIVKNETDALALVSKTLMHVQKESVLKDQRLEVCIMSALQALKKSCLIRCTQPVEQNTLDKTAFLPGKYVLEVSKLGRATFKGSIDLDYANQLYEDLQKGLQSLILNAHLHLLYLVTPYDMIDSIPQNPQIYYDAYTNLSAEDTAVAVHLGITEACIMKIVVGKKPINVSEFVIRRFYLTLILHCLWQQQSIWSVAERFQLPRGHIQNLLMSSASFATSTLHFCREIEEFWAYQDLLTNFTKQLSHCVNMELIPLMELPNIKKGRAHLLYNAGFKDIQAIAQADPEVLVKTIERMPRKVAIEIVEAAKVTLIKKAEELQEEVEDLVALINE